MLPCRGQAGAHGWVRVVGIAARRESMRLVVLEGRATGGPRCLLVVPLVLGPGRQTTLAPTCAIFRRHVRCISKGAMAPRHDWSVGSFPGFPVSPPSVALKRSSPGLHPRSQDCTYVVFRMYRSYLEARCPLLWKGGGGDLTRAGLGLGRA